MTTLKHPVPDLATLSLDSLLTTNEVAEIFRLSAGRIRNLRSAGRAPKAIRLGRDVKMRVRDVLAWIDAHAEAENP